MTTEYQNISEVCNLPEDELESRLKMTREELFPLVRKREELENGLALYFDDQPEMGRRLEEFVQFERKCCSGIDWTVERRAGQLRLEIAGIDPRSKMFASIGEASLGDSSATKPSLLPRLFRAVGLGSAGAILACCIMPLVLVAVIGATPLLLLDNPWVIGASALGLGFALWRWEARRETRRRAGEASGACGC